MNNQFRNELLVLLDNKYDEITYDIDGNFLEVTVDKKLCFKDLSDLIKDLCEEILYPLSSFHSDYDRYIFTYKLMDK